MQPPLHVLIVGGGVAALEATLALRDLAEDRVAIEVLAPDEEFVYRPMAVAEPFQHGEARRFPLRPLVERAGAQLTTGALARLDLELHKATTAEGAVIEWDVLVLALGMRTREGVAGGLTFRGPDDRAAMTEIVDDALAGRVRSLTFALPTLAAWPLPLYELALLTKTTLEDAGAVQVETALVTPESAPLRIFGPKVAASLENLLELRGIALRTNTTPVVFRNGALVVVPGRAIRTERVVSVPVAVARRIPGIPATGSGFVQTDQHGRVEGSERVYAAGDMTTFPLKQGGIAAQQADAVAESIAALAGAPITPRPFKPVLRGLLLTGLSPQFLRASVLDAESEIDTEALWWPPGKIAGRYLGPFLAEHMHLSGGVVSPR